MSPAPTSAAPESIAVALLLAITALCCWPAIDAPFTYDETAGIADNRAIHPGAPMASALAYRFSPDQTRPLFFLSLWADARLFGISPRPFRATNIALHLLCGLLVYRLLRRLSAGGAGARPIVGRGLSFSRPVGAALAGMALFLLHPLQSESIIYTWGRSEVLSTLLAVEALLLAPLGRPHGTGAGRRPGANRGGDVAAWMGALLCLALSLAAKEEAVVLPLVAFIWWAAALGEPPRAAARGAVVLSLPVGVFIAIRWLMLGAAGRQVYVRSVGENILSQAVVSLRMVRLFVLPLGQSVDHAADQPSLPAGLLALLVCLALAAAAVVVAWPALLGRPRRGGARSTGAGSAGGRWAAWIAAGVLIAAAGTLLYWLVPLPDLMSERRAYLPMLGAALGLVGAVGWFEGRRAGVGAGGRGPSAPRGADGPGRSRWTALLPATILLVLLAPALAARARLWSDSVRLWDEAARLAPRRARPLINLGVLAADAKRLGEAATFFDRAVALEPTNGEALFNRARLRLDAGDVKGALADLETAAASGPARVIVWINLGIARIRAGDLPGAERSLRTALEIDPDEPRALANLAEVLRATGRAADALPLYRRAMAADPRYAWAAIRLAVALEAANDRPAALAAYREALVRGPATSADRDAVLKKVAALEAALAAPAPAPVPSPRPR